MKNMVRHNKGRPTFFGPKRVVRRVRAYVFVTVFNTQSNFIAFTAPEDMTLVRMKIDGSILYQIEGTALQTAEINLNIRPRGSEVIEPLVSSIASKIDDDVPDQDLFTKLFMSLNNVADNDIHRLIIKDNKAMRKLNKSDQISLSHISSASNAWKLIATIDMWFKLA